MDLVLRWRTSPRRLKFAVLCPGTGPDDAAGIAKLVAEGAATEANSAGFSLAYRDKATADWHEAFRVWFGGTYYMTEFANPDEARAAVQQTWERWLAVAKARFVPANLQNDKTLAHADENLNHRGK